MWHLCDSCIWAHMTCRPDARRKKNTCKLAWLTEKGELKKPLTMAITVSVTYFSRAGSAWLRSVVVLHTCNNNKHQHDYTQFITIEFRPSLLNNLFVFLYRLNTARVWTFQTDLHGTCPPGSCQRASKYGWTCRSPSFLLLCPRSNDWQSSHKQISPTGHSKSCQGMIQLHPLTQFICNENLNIWIFSRKTYQAFTSGTQWMSVTTRTISSSGSRELHFSSV